MHAALFAMMVHAQEMLIEKIDGVYITKLRGILGDIRDTRMTSRRLLSERNRPDQRRALEANVKAQNFAEKVASFYRDYLLTQRQPARRGARADPARSRHCRQYVRNGRGKFSSSTS